MKEDNIVVVVVVYGEEVEWTMLVNKNYVLAFCGQQSYPVK